VGRSAKLALPDPLAEFSVGRSRREFSPALGTAFLGFYAFPVPVASPVRHGALAGF
jgi:hypothetical protein